MAVGIQVMGTGMGDTRTIDALVAEVLPDLDAAEPLWRRLETDPASLLTPYQRFDWARAYLRSTGQAEAARVVVLRDLLVRLEVACARSNP